MNGKVFFAVLAIIFVGIAGITLIQAPGNLRAEDSDEIQFYLPVITVPDGPELVKFVDHLAPPTVVTGLVDPGDGRLFIATRDGRIQISAADGTVQPQLLLDIRDRVYDDANEAGLVGLVTHPDYANNGYIYVHYNELLEVDDFYSVIARYTVGSNGQADPATEKRILHIQLPTARHHGGALQFGPMDGFLYISIGDGGTGRDNGNYGQSTNTLLGKILRVDVDNGDPYAIPADNPFVADENSRDEIWALGLRNPWRISFDQQTGDMYIGDVGETTWEEVNFIPGSSSGGENFGWSCWEGPDELGPDHCVEGVDYTGPIFTYMHSPSGCGSVTAGFIYRGTQIPEFDGRFIVADFCRGKMWSLIKPSGDQGWQAVYWGPTGKNITTFGEGHDGELYVGANDVYLLAGTGQSELFLLKQ